MFPKSLAITMALALAATAAAHPLSAHNLDPSSLEDALERHLSHAPGGPHAPLPPAGPAPALRGNNLPQVLGTHPSYAISTGGWQTIVNTLGVSYINTTNSRFVLTDASGEETYLGVRQIAPPCYGGKCTFVVMVLSERRQVPLKPGPLKVELQILEDRLPAYTIEILPTYDFPVVNDFKPSKFVAGETKTMELTGVNFSDKMVCNWWRNCGGGGGSIVDYKAISSTKTSVVCPVPDCVCLGPIGVSVGNVLPEFPSFDVMNSSSSATTVFANPTKTCPSLTPLPSAV